MFNKISEKYYNRQVCHIAQYTRHSTSYQHGNIHVHSSTWIKPACLSFELVSQWAETVCGEVSSARMRILVLVRMLLRWTGTCCRLSLPGLHFHPPPGEKMDENITKCIHYISASMKNLHQCMVRKGQGIYVLNMLTTSFSKITQYMYTYTSSHWILG